MLADIHPRGDLVAEVTPPLSSGRRVVRILESAEINASRVDLFLTHEQARQLADAILTALYPETAAMAESLDATVQ